MNNLTQEQVSELSDLELDLEITKLLYPNQPDGWYNAFMRSGNGGVTRRMTDKERIQELENILNIAINGYKEAVQDIEGWAAYASDYFKQKHNLEGDLLAHQKVIALLQEKANND